MGGLDKPEAATEPKDTKSVTPWSYQKRDYIPDDELSKLLHIYGKRYAKPHHEYYSDARDLIDDITFIESFYHRTKRHKRMQLEMSIVGLGADHYWFVKRIFANFSPSWWREEKNLITKLRIIDICHGMASSLLSKENAIDEDTLHDAIDFEWIYAYYTSLETYRENLLGLIYYGCQTDTSNIVKRWDELTQVTDLVATDC